MPRHEAIKIRELTSDVIINQVGMFFEAYQEDAAKIAVLLDRQLDDCVIDGKFVPLVAIPYHEIDKLLNTLIANGLQWDIRG